VIVREKYTLVERLDRRTVEMDNGCWEWCGYRGPQGYGQIGNEAGRPESAHRVSYRLRVGPIPPGVFVCHRCDNPPCVNPDHLFLGTPGDNVRDMLSKGREARGFDLPHTRLTETQVREIRARYVRSYGPTKRGGRSSNADVLAEEYGVGRTYIMNIVHGHERKGVQ
jgi:hypothetical protein